MDLLLHAINYNETTSRKRETCRYAEEKGIFMRARIFSLIPFIRAYLAIFRIRAGKRVPIGPLEIADKNAHAYEIGPITRWNTFSNCPMTPDTSSLLISLEGHRQALSSLQNEGFNDL